MFRVNLETCEITEGNGFETKIVKFFTTRAKATSYLQLHLEDQVNMARAAFVEAKTRLASFRRQEGV